MSRASLRDGFVADALSNGSKFRLLTVVDVFSREALAIEIGSRLRGENVVEVLNRLIARHGAPKFVFVDNGSELTGRLINMRAYDRQVRIDFSRPGKPTDNGHVETFNGSLRDELEHPLVRVARRGQSDRRGMAA